MIEKSTLRVYDTTERLHLSAAELLVEVMRRALSEQGTCSVALSGGATPRLLYHHLGGPPLRESVEWERVHLLFGDERAVPPGDPQSNYSMVERELLSRVPIPPGNVHRIAGEKEPTEAAREYESDVKEVLAHGGGKIDCVLLGLGGDGHTASLFPGSSALREKSALVRAVVDRRTGLGRVTMTLPLINSARRVIFVVAGKEKAGIVRRVLRERGPTVRLPATMVRPPGGEVLWLIDRAAASGLL